MINKLIHSFRKSTMFKYQPCNYCYHSGITSKIIFLFYIMLLHFRTFTCTAHKALISINHIYTSYYMIMSINYPCTSTCTRLCKTLLLVDLHSLFSTSISYGIYSLTIVIDLYKKCIYIKLSSMSLLYNLPVISNIRYSNILMKSTSYVLSMSHFSVHNFMRACIQIVLKNTCNFLNVFNNYSISGVYSYSYDIVTHIRVAKCVCIYSSQCPPTLVNIIMYVYFIHVFPYKCKVFHYSCDININCNVHVYISYLISCVSRLEAHSLMSIYSAITIVVAILEQYVYSKIVRRFQFIAMLSFPHEHIPKKYSKLFLIDNLYESLILVMHSLWFNHSTLCPAIHSTETLVKNISLVLNYIAFFALTGHPHVTALFVIHCFVFANLALLDGS